MANEFVHGTVGTELTQAEFEAIGLHVLNSQATGDVIYASSATQLTRLGIGSAAQVLTVTGGVPAWAAAAAAAGEGHIFILAINYDSIGAGSLGLALNSLAFLGYEMVSGGADLENFLYKAYLGAGTYTLQMILRTSTNYGILDIDIDDTEVASFDLYSADTYNVTKTQTGIVVASAGLKTIKLRVDGKNASSTDHYVRPIFIVLWRTA